MALVQRIQTSFLSSRTTCGSGNLLLFISKGFVFHFGIEFTCSTETHLTSIDILALSRPRCFRSTLESCGTLRLSLDEYRILIIFRRSRFYILFVLKSSLCSKFFYCLLKLSLYPSYQMRLHGTFRPPFSHL